MSSPSCIREDMAARKRVLVDLPEEDGNGGGTSFGEKRMKTLPSLSTVMRQVLAVKSLQNFAACLEPILRQVVKEEVERGLYQAAVLLQRSPRRQIQEANGDSILKLAFSGEVSGTLFTGNKIKDKDDNPLQIRLEGTSASLPPPLPSPIRVEIVVIDGDFPGDRDDWTSEEFDRKILKERTGKRPLLAGEALFTLRDENATIDDLFFTDNSSWIRSRRFRLGARVIPGSCPGLSVREAMTGPFMVKDHRGESSKKHYPPSLHDDVWRLKNIAKDGTFHKKLQAEGINTVQDFLWRLFMDPDRLRSLVGLADKPWESTVGHAKTCDMGDKLYVHRREESILVLSPVGKPEGVLIDGHSLPLASLDRQQQVQVQHLVLEAYENFDKLEEVDEAHGRAILQPQTCSSSLPQIATGASYVAHQYPSDQLEEMSWAYQSVGFHGDHLQVDLSEWIPQDYSALLDKY